MTIIKYQEERIKELEVEQQYLHHQNNILKQLLQLLKGACK